MRRSGFVSIKGFSLGGLVLFDTELIDCANPKRPLI